MVQVLPPDSARIADESALLIMDIVVQLADGSITNVEVQKIGYRFPGERCACYSADLLLRQYRRVREDWDGKERERLSQPADETGYEVTRPVRKRFSYQNIKNVYTIVLFEKSPEAFHEFQDTYLHHAEQKTDTGLKINLLQEYRRNITLLHLIYFEKPSTIRAYRTNWMRGWCSCRWRNRNRS